MICGKCFDENFESHNTKEDIRKMMVNIDIIPILFTVKNILNNLENPAEGKTKSTPKRKFQQLENKAKQHFFSTLNAAVMHICNDLDIAKRELYEYSSKILIYCAFDC